MPLPDETEPPPRTASEDAGRAEDRGSQERTDPTKGKAAQRLAKGFSYPLSTVGYIIRRPGLWGYAILPVLITACILVLILAGLFTWGDELTGKVWARPEEWYWLLLWYPFHFLSLVLIFVVGAVTLPGLISSPFNKALSRRTEQLEAAEKAAKGGLKRFFTGLPSTLLNELRKIGFLLLVHLCLLALVLIPVAGQIAYAVLAWIWTILWLAAQNLDFSLSRHGHSFMDTPRLVRRNMLVSFGFGLAVFVILLVPFFNFLFVPVSVVAGTRLFLDMKGAGAVVEPSE